MLVIPAIDLKSGCCVRLAQGDFNRSTVYSDQPEEVARGWQEMGAELIHVVDLDGSVAGSPANQEVIRRMVRAVSIPLQVGGGIRDRATIETYLKMGVKRVILGTGAACDEQFVRRALAAYPGSIVLGVDALDGRVAIRGWTEQTKLRPADVVRKYADSSPAAVIFTDIRRDGMQTGVNIAATRELAREVSIPVIASGGVASLQDIVNLMEVEEVGIAGVIVGKALYSGALDLRIAIKAAKRHWKNGDIH